MKYFWKNIKNKIKFTFAARISSSFSRSAAMTG
jgi:hypothetical protein